MRSTCFFTLVLLAACPDRSATAPVKPPAAPTPAGMGCLAERIGTLTLQVKESTKCDVEDCRDECVSGDVSACMTRAQKAEEEAYGQGEAALLYARACELGAAQGCTNYAATIWATDGRTDKAMTCAANLFTKACDARDPFACGMLGRLLLEDADPPKTEEGKKLLEGACVRLKGFPCRVLAMHLETGKLGDYPKERIKSLLAESCDGGDPDGCGDPANAADTFNE